MNNDHLFTLSTIMTVLMLIVQRVEPKSRKRVSYIILFTVGVLLVFYINLRNAWGEAIVSFFIAGFINLLFWVLIGRYNPVRNSDETIQVLGMDD